MLINSAYQDNKLKQQQVSNNKFTFKIKFESAK